MASVTEANATEYALNHQGKLVFFGNGFEIPEGRKEFELGGKAFGLAKIVGYKGAQVIVEFERLAEPGTAECGTPRYKYGPAAKWLIEDPETDQQWAIPFDYVKSDDGYVVLYDDFKGTKKGGAALVAGAAAGEVSVTDELAHKIREKNIALTVKDGKTVKRSFNNVDVQYAADEQITLPVGMSYKDARDWLTRKERESEKEVALAYKIEGYPVDAALAFYKAMQKVYGFTSLVNTPGFFGPTPPAMIGVEISLTETVQIPWGSMQISGIDGRLETGIDFKDGKPTLTIGGMVKQKHKDKVDDLVSLAKKILERESIYKGKAIRVEFQDYNPKDPRFDPLKAPKFMDLSRVNPAELVFSESVRRQVEVTLWTPIRKTELSRKFKIPRRRGALLAGKYGTGKTLAASVTAKECVDNKWTFIYLSDVKELPQAIHFAKLYAPALIFAEDINRIVGDKRDAEIDKIFNTLDGVDTKHTEIMVVFTTNDIDDIHPGMMRPGRIDTIIEVTPPDALAAQKLVRLYGRGLVDPKADLTRVGLMLDGYLPAVIREAVERSKLAALSHLTDDQDTILVTAADLEDAAAQMAVHRKFVEPVRKAKPTDMEVLGNVLGAYMSDGLEKALDAAGRPKTVPVLGNGLHEKEVTSPVT